MKQKQPPQIQQPHIRVNVLTDRELDAPAEDKDILMTAPIAPVVVAEIETGLVDLVLAGVVAVAVVLVAAIR